MLRCLCFLLTFLCTKSTNAQQNCDGKVVPYTVSIAGRTDSVSLEMILKAGKIESVNKAFDIISFTLSTGCFRNGGGSFSSIDCESALFSKKLIAFIKKIPPGFTFTLSCIKVENKIGKIYFLNPQVMKISAGDRGSTTDTSRP